MSFLKFFIFFLFLISEISSDPIFEDEDFIDFYKSDIYFKNYFNPFFNQSLSYIKFLSDSEEINPKCRSSLKRWTEGIENSETWALKLFESTGHNIQGRLLGGNVNFGSFSYCTDFISKPEKNIDFDGKYCLVSIQTKDSEKFKQLDGFKSYQTKLSKRSQDLVQFNLGSAQGLCMPSTCEIEEIASVFDKQFKSYGFSMIPPKSCTTPNEYEPITLLQIISISILSIFIILCLMSYFVENDFLSNFSLVDNYKIIYSNESTYNEDDESIQTISILHGTKAFLVIFSTAAHCYLLYGVFYIFPVISTRHLTESTESSFNLITLFKIFYEKLYLFADQLFFCGGFFAMFAWYTILKRKKMKFNFIPFFVGRYIRVLITVFPVILIYFVMPLLGFGPLFSDLTNHFSENCKQGFYHILLLISHRQSVLDMCIVPAWFFNIDFLIYIINYFLIYYLITKPTIGFLLSIGQMILFSMITVFYVVKDKIDVFYSFMDFKPYDMAGFDALYFSMYTHYNTYVLGVLCAYMVKNRIKFKILKSKIVRLIIWIVLGIMVLSVYGYPYYLKRTNTTPPEVIRLMFPIFDKIFVSLMMFWIYYSVLSGYSNWYRPMLCMKIWVPISRLSFSLIVSQFIYLGYSFPTSRMSHSASFVPYLKEFAACLFYSFIIGNLIFLFFEAPLISITKKYFGLKDRQAKRQKIIRQITLDEVNNNLKLKTDKIDKEINKF